jgi:hypothetical protein
MKTAINTKIIPNKSLIIKYGINGIKSDLFFLLDYSIHIHVKMLYELLIKIVKQKANKNEDYKIDVMMHLL